MDFWESGVWKAWLSWNFNRKMITQLTNNSPVFTNLSWNFIKQLEIDFENSKFTLIFASLMIMKRESLLKYFTDNENNLT